MTVKREKDREGGNSEVRERVTGFNVRKERWCELGESEKKKVCDAKERERERERRKCIERV